MNKMSEAARAANKAKAHRMANGSGPGDDPSKRIDASGWAEPTNMHLNAKVGARPVSRSAYKRGGAVSGDCAPKRADRKARASGGRGIVNDFLNRDVKAANAEIGRPHDGGWASGGATNFRKTMHNEMGVAENKHGRRDGIGKFQRSHKASGGAANDPAGMRPKGGRIAKKHGGKAKGKTNIVIGIHAGQPPQQPMTAGGPSKPPMPMAPPSQMPPQGPPPGGMGMPPGMMPQPGLQGAPQFPRASGGRAGRKEGGPVIGAKYKAADPNKAERVKRVKDIPAGNGGLGRLAKRSIAQRTFVRPV